MLAVVGPERGPELRAGSQEPEAQCRVHLGRQGLSYLRQNLLPATVCIHRELKSGVETGIKCRHSSMDLGVLFLGPVSLVVCVFFFFLYVIVSIRFCHFLYEVDFC